VPTTEPDAVREGGQLVTECKDVEVTGYSAGTLDCRITSGRYEFTSRYDRSAGAAPAERRSTKEWP